MDAMGSRMLSFCWAKELSQRESFRKQKLLSQASTRPLHFEQRMNLQKALCSWLRKFQVLLLVTEILYQVFSHWPRILTRIFLYIPGGFCICCTQHMFLKLFLDITTWRIVAKPWHFMKSWLVHHGILISARMTSSLHNYNWAASFLNSTLWKY